MSKFAISLSIFLMCCVAFPGAAFAKTKDKKSVTALTLLKDVSKKYRNTKIVKIESEKKVTSELLGKTTTYLGWIYLSQGKFRWETETPEQSLLVFNGETIWNVQYPPKDLGGPVQVAIAKLNKNTKSQILISTLIGKEPIDKNFKIISEKNENGMNTIQLQPLSSDLRVKDLTLDVEVGNKEIKKISYKDDVENLTEIIMKKTIFGTRDRSELFKYEPPKDAQVTNL